MPKPPEPKAKPQCEFAMDSTTQDRCRRTATCKWGDQWFCDEHGDRDRVNEAATELATEAASPRPLKGVILAHGGCC